MSSSSPYTAKWGIMACGSIAKKFTQDLLLNPSDRQVNDVKHEVIAVASSSSEQKAKDFVKETQCPSHTKTYGSYEDLVKDPNVQIVYVASPHTFHYENSLLALENGKSVCCEKPFTINAEQTKHLVQIAKKNNLFLMEAVWTRFFPLVLSLQKAIHQDRILGNLIRVQADLSKKFDFDPNHRLYNKELGGGALLDLGLYPATWLMMTLFSDPKNNHSLPSSISSTIVKVPQTGVDAHSVATLVFDKARTIGTLSCSLEIEGFYQHYHTIIQGEKGTITVQGQPYRPEGFTVFLNDENGNPGPPQQYQFQIPGQGMFWEADACARDLRDGKIENSLCSWTDSIATMTVFDTIRKQNDFTYGPKLEGTRT